MAIKRVEIKDRTRGVCRYTVRSSAPKTEKNSN
jgi:hypothetical protein